LELIKNSLILLSEIIAEEPEVSECLASRFASLILPTSQRTYGNATVFTRVYWDGNCEKYWDMIP